jgi:ABC transporter substrate binding protein
MRRRPMSVVRGVAALGVLTLPLMVAAQPPTKTVTIGVLAIEPWAPIDTFRQALKDLGYVEGQNVRFDRFVRERVDALMVLTDSYFLSQRRRIAMFALPSVYTYRDHAEAGGLIAYTTNYHVLFRRAAGYVGKILRGAKPGDLPIEQATRFDLIINARTAKALGLTVPQSVLARADEIIQ